MRGTEKTGPGELERLFGLKGKVAIVTGAAGQLGGEYVRCLLGAGARVGAFDINFNNPGSTLPDEDSEDFIKVRVDVTDRASIERGLDEVIKKLGSPNILVNNAGIDVPPDSTVQTGPFETYPESSWDEIMRVNLKGMMLCCQVIGGYMAQNGGGSIINIASIYGILSPDQRIYQYRERPFFKPISYCVSKSGVLNLTRYLATYWAGKNVRVNTLTLGGVFNNQDERFIKNYSNRVPLGRMARADEYNGAILLLASDASSYMTGANLVVDGGYSCW